MQVVYCPYEFWLNSRVILVPVRSLQHQYAVSGKFRALPQRAATSLTLVHALLMLCSLPREFSSTPASQHKSNDFKEKDGNAHFDVKVSSLLPLLHLTKSFSFPVPSFLGDGFHTCCHCAAGPPAKSPKFPRSSTVPTKLTVSAPSSRRRWYAT